MAWANLVRSTREVSSGNKICSKHSDNAKSAAIYYKLMYGSLQSETPPMRVRTFSGGVNSLCNMVNNRSHDFHSTVASSATSVEKASPVFPKGDKFETYKDKANKVSQFARRFNYNLVGMVNRSHRFYSTVPSSAISENSHPFLPKGSGKASPILPMGDDIFQTLTDKAKEVIKFAQMETRPFGYKFVGTEMILLGLIGDGTGKFLGECTDIAEMVFLSMNIRLNDARIKVKEMFGCSGPPSISVPVEIPFRCNALRAFQQALAEAQQLGHNYIGSEHLFLGLLGDEDAILLLEELGASPVEIRKLVRRMIKERAAQVVGDGSFGNETPTLVEYVELADEPIAVPATTVDETIKIFKGIKKEAVVAAVQPSSPAYLKELRSHFQSSHKNPRYFRSFHCSRWASIRASDDLASINRSDGGFGSSEGRFDDSGFGGFGGFGSNAGSVHSGGLVFVEAMTTSMWLWKRTYCQRIPGLLPYPSVQYLWNQLRSVEKKDSKFWKYDYFGTPIFRGAYRDTGVLGWNIHPLDIKQDDGSIKTQMIIVQTKIWTKLKEGTVGLDQLH